MSDPLLQVEELYTHFHTDDGLVKAVDGVDFHLSAGETLGIVGESGCGKSVTARSILRIVPQPPGTVEGRILFEGVDLLKLSEARMRKIRGNEISMIFQEPMTSLNPVYTIGFQITEAIRLHQGKKQREAIEIAVEILRSVGIPLPEQRINDYPFQMSGGMRQRAMIAMAISCNPKLLIADEPTTALDVTIQAQILELLKQLKEQTDSAVILITHDLAVIAEVTERVIVMYAGKIVESADVKTLFKNPSHPYTVGLLNSIPKITEEVERLQAIEGVVPIPTDLPPGCSFVRGAASQPSDAVLTTRCSKRSKPATAFGVGITPSCSNQRRPRRP